jgi:hypothetical protein
MKHKILVPLILLGLLITWQPLVAHDPDLQATLQKMQAQLEQQQKELAEQRILIQQLQESQQTAGTEPHTAAVAKPTDDPAVAAQQPGTDTPLPAADQSGQQQAVEALAQQQQVAPETSQEKYEALQKKILNDPSNTIYDPDFPGAWYLPGTTAAMKVGGYVDLSVVNSFDPMLQPDRFIVGSIPPKGEPVAGAEKGTNVTASRSRVNLEYREQTKQGEIRAFVEGDFQGDGDTFRLRHAYGQFHSVLAGRTWSTLMNMNADPEVLDNEGISGQIHVTHAEVRWSPQFGEKLKLEIALEDPQTDVINGQGVRGRSDLVASLQHMPHGLFGHRNFKAGVILRDLKANQNNGSPNENTTGWGITASGRHPFKRSDGKDFLLWQLTYGEGIGHYINDLNTVGGGDAVFDPQGQLRALPVFAGYVSYLHEWPMTWGFVKSWPGILRSSLNLSWVDINNYQFQEDSDYKSTREAALNLIYSPTANINMGVEFLWGERTNRDESKGTAKQLQMGIRYDF